MKHAFYVSTSMRAPFEPLPTATAKPKLDSSGVTFASEDGTMLAGVVSRPPGVTKKLPAIVFVPPGAGVGRNFGGEGPDPIYPDLAFAMRGYVVIRYDARGVAKSGGSREIETWEQSLAGAEAAERYAQANDGIDAARIYALGYGSGGDLALASAASGNASENLAGVVALAPTSIAYRECAKATKSLADVWQKSALAHDPVAFATRGHDPILVFHPGISRCGESSEALVAYDDRLRANNSRATIPRRSVRSAIGSIAQSSPFVPRPCPFRRRRQRRRRAKRLCRAIQLS